MDCLEAQIHHLMISHVQRERTWKNKISGGSKLYRPILIGCMRNMTTVCGFQILCFCRLAPAILQVKPVCLLFKTCNNNISMVKTYIYIYVFHDSTKHQLFMGLPGNLHRFMVKPQFLRKDHPQKLSFFAFRRATQQGIARLHGAQPWLAVWLRKGFSGGLSYNLLI